jgi:MFS superfamily sulfate permease-like transporter
MVTARSFAVKKRYEIDSNQEFIALGVADIGAGLLQGFAISGADSRTAVNDSVGGKSQVTGLVETRPRCDVFCSTPRPCLSWT